MGEKPANEIEEQPIVEEVAKSPDSKPTFAAMGSIGSKDEDEKSFKEKIANEIEQKLIVEEVVKAPELKLAFAGLPIDDTAEDWMNDDMGTINSEDEDEKPFEEKIANEIEQKPIVEEVTKASESKPQLCH